MVGEFDVGSKSNPSLGKNEYITLGSSLNAAIDLHLSGDLVGAEKAYRSLIIQGQKDHAIYGNLAAICMVRGQREEAIKLLNQSLKLNPCYSEAYYNLGIALQLQGDLEAAIAHYQKALNLNPNYPEAYLNLGNTVRDRGDIEAAIAYYQKALELNPNYPQIHYNLGHALEEQEQWEDAIAHYRKAIELYPNYPEAHKNLSYALLITGDFKNGWDEYEYRFTNPTAQAKINIPRNMTKWDWNLHYQGE
jgi:tetratricopeptide (TPR) repeat protein